MAFGLGAGAGFYYLTVPDTSPTRWFNGRTARLEESFRELTGAALRMRTFSEPEQGWEAARTLVDGGRPALLLTDLYHLDYYGRSAHFPGHAVVLAGYDDDEALLSDTGFEELQRAGLENLARARSQPPPSLSARGAPVHGRRRRRPRLAPRRGPRRGRARRTRDAGARLERDRRDARPEAARRRGSSWPKTAPDWQWCARFGYQVIEKRGTGRRQLQADVLALPRGGRLRGGAARREASRAVDRALRRLPRGERVRDPRTGPVDARSATPPQPAPKRRNGSGARSRADRCRARRPARARRPGGSAQALKRAK